MPKITDQETRNAGGLLKDKIALVTGAASGLGRAIALDFADQGAYVIASDIDEDKISELGEQLSNRGQAIVQDVTCEKSWRRIIKDVSAHHGALHILVNNAGIGNLGSIEDISLDQFRHIHRVDLDSVFLGCKHALPLMSKVQGSIINMSSLSAMIADSNLIAYDSAKAAVRHLTKSVALHAMDRGYPVRCNSVHPAFVDTPILDGWVVRGTRDEMLQKLGRNIPMGRIGRPEEITCVVTFLASEESRFINGAELVVDGGRLAA